MFQIPNVDKPDKIILLILFIFFQKYGVALSALARLQMNVIVDKHNGFGYFDNIADDKVYLPFGWLEEGVLGPSDVSACNILNSLNSHVLFLFVCRPIRHRNCVCVCVCVCV